MIKYIIILIASLSSVSLAALTCETKKDVKVVEEKKDVNTAVPKNLKGAKIIIKTADGKETEMEADKFKVVPRKQQFVTTKVVEVHSVECSPKVVERIVEKEPLKNRVSLHGGMAPQVGLTRSVHNNGNMIEVESNVGPTLGVQYQRLVTERVSLSAEAQTNKTLLLGVGLDF